MHIDELSFEIEMCAACPLMCKDLCCFHQHAKTEESAPHIRNMKLLKIIKEDESLENVAETIYQCTLCGQCTAWCDQSRDIPNNMMAGRADIVENGFAPESVIEIEKRTEKEYNPYGKPQEDRTSKVSDTTRKYSKGEKGDVGIWIGCTESYHQTEMLESLAKILDAASADFQFLVEDERCCGLPQYKLGLRKNAKKLAKHNKKIIEDKGFKTLIVDCPECYRAFKEFYPDWGTSLEVDIIHSSEYLQDLIKKEKLQMGGELNKKVTYHDPCELSRHTTPTVRTGYETSDIYYAPREVLKAIPGINFEEMRWNKIKTYCCGGEVGMREIYPEISFEIGKKVPNEALKAGAEILAVACPECKLQFSSVIEEEGLSLEVYSIQELVDQAL